MALWGHEWAAVAWMAAAVAEDPFGERAEELEWDDTLECELAQRSLARDQEKWEVQGARYVCTSGRFLRCCNCHMDCVRAIELGPDLGYPGDEAFVCFPCLRDYMLPQPEDITAALNGDVRAFTELR